MTNTLRNALEQAFEKHESVEEEKAESTKIEEPEVIEEDNEELEQAASAPDEESEADEKPQEKAASSTELDIEPPEHWSIHDKEVFNEQTARGKEYFLRRTKEMESSFTKKNMEFADEIKFLKNFKEKLRPFEPYLKQNNIDPLDAFEKILSTDIRFRTSPTEEKLNLLKQVAYDYGIPLSSQDPDQPIDYQQQAYLDKLYTMEERLNRFEKDKVVSEQNYYQKTIDSFAQSKDENGKPKYPYFEDLKSDMSMLLAAGKAETLEEAYNQSIYLNPSLRNDIIMRQSNNERRIADKKIKTEAAKRAGFNIKSSGQASIADQPKELGLRDTLSQIYDDMANSV